MAWPPLLPSTARTLMTGPAPTHQDDHNKIAVALADIVGIQSTGWVQGVFTAPVPFGTSFTLIPWTGSRKIGTPANKVGQGVVVSVDSTWLLTTCADINGIANASYGYVRVGLYRASALVWEQKTAFSGNPTGSDRETIAMTHIVGLLANDELRFEGMRGGAASGIGVAGDAMRESGFTLYHLGNGIQSEALS